MRLLLPETSDRVNLFELYSREVKVPADRPFVRVQHGFHFGRRRRLFRARRQPRGAGDRLLFSVLRSLADVVLVGAGTARVERYGPAKIPLEAQDIRRQTRAGSPAHHGGGDAVWRARLGVPPVYRRWPPAHSDRGRGHPL